jgi:large subunit ribosomal protein L10
VLSLLKGSYAIIFTETSNAPAKLIKNFREQKEKPLLKAAFVESDTYVGDDQLDALINIKSKEQLIGDIILILQSPMQNVLGALQSGGNTIGGLLKTLENR